jgi:hypothetical protein
MTLTEATSTLHRWEAATERREAALAVVHAARAAARHSATQQAWAALTAARAAYHDADDEVQDLADDLVAEGWQIARLARLDGAVEGLLRIP